MNIEEQEFTEIYNVHASKVFRICLGYASGDENQAHEWQQETFIKIWKHRKTFKGKSSIGTWIYRVAVNVCLSDLRKHKKYVPLNNDILTSISPEFDEDGRANEIEKMYFCINQLGKKHKTLILLELEDIPQTTIAETLGLSHGAVRTRLNRIRKTLLKCIKDEKQ